MKNSRFRITTFLPGGRRSFRAVFPLLAIFLAQAFTAPVPDPTVGPKTAHVSKWRPLFRGIEEAHAETDRPRPLRVHAVRIDLTEPTVEFFVTPSNGERPLDTDGLKTSSFLKKYRLQVAINATPFKPLVKKEGEPQDVLGLSVSCGDRYSPPVPPYGALVISKKNKARIVTPPIGKDGVYNGVGGFRLLLKAGKNVGTAGKAIN